MKNSARFVALVMILGIIAAGCSIGGGLTVHALFDDVGDLVNRASVQFADVKIGSVTGIDLEGYQAKVTMRIDPGIDIPANAGALVRSTSLLGEKFVEIVPPTGDPPEGRLSDGDVIPSERTGKRAELEEVFLKLGAILEGGGMNDLATFIESSAAMVRDQEAVLGDVFGELRRLTGTIASRSEDIGAAVDALDTAFGAFGEGSSTLSSAVASSAEAAEVLARRQADLDRLVTALDRFSRISASYTVATTDSNDRALKDLRAILDEVMKTTSDLDRSLTALARFVDLWPKVIPSDYVQLDVAFTTENTKP